MAMQTSLLLFLAPVVFFGMALFVYVLRAVFAVRTRMPSSTPLAFYHWNFELRPDTAWSSVSVLLSTHQLTLGFWSCGF